MAATALHDARRAGQPDVLLLLQMIERYGSGPPSRSLRNTTPPCSTHSSTISRHLVNRIAIACSPCHHAQPGPSTRNNLESLLPGTHCNLLPRLAPASFAMRAVQYCHPYPEATGLTPSSAIRCNANDGRTHLARAPRTGNHAIFSPTPARHKRTLAGLRPIAHRLGPDTQILRRRKLRGHGNPSQCRHLACHPHQPRPLNPPCR